MLIYMHTKINVEPECLRKDFGWPCPKQGGMISPFLKHCFQAVVASPLHMFPPAKCLKALLCFETPANYSLFKQIHTPTKQYWNLKVIIILWLLK
jgi:hypothetical protein